MADERFLNRVENKLEQAVVDMERMGVAEYVEMLHHPRRLLLNNFLAGVARGLGTAVGFTLLGALVIYLMNRLVMLNLPGISSFLATLVKMVLERTYY